MLPKALSGNNGFNPDKFTANHIGATLSQVSIMDGKRIGFIFLGQFKFPNPSD
jgi:hypothetical protein